LHLRLDASRLHLFDPASGHALTAAMDPANRRIDARVVGSIAVDGPARVGEEGRHRSGRAIAQVRWLTR
jgi:hypothetical protein